MIDVIQVFKSVYAINKSRYNSDSRAMIKEWPDYVQSKNGYVHDHVLVLPDQEQLNPDLQKAGLIVIQDIEGFDPVIINRALEKNDFPDWFKEQKLNYIWSYNQQIKCFPASYVRCDFEMFGIVKLSDKSFEITLNYLLHQHSIGLPKRQDHKIADLEQGKAVSYRINGKIDGHADRVFMEYKYIIQYLGQVDTIEFMAPNKMEINKKLPIERMKVVDERKVLK